MLMNNKFKSTFFKSLTEILKTYINFKLSRIIHIGYEQLAKMRCLVIQVCQYFPIQFTSRW